MRKTEKRHTTPLGEASKARVAAATVQLLSRLSPGLHGDARARRVSANLARVTGVLALAAGAQLATREAVPDASAGPAADHAAPRQALTAAVSSPAVARVGLYLDALGADQSVARRMAGLWIDEARQRGGLPEAVTLAALVAMAETPGAAVLMAERAREQGPEALANRALARFADLPAVRRADLVDQLRTAPERMADYLPLQDIFEPAATAPAETPWVGQDRFLAAASAGPVPEGPDQSAPSFRF